MYHSFGTTLNPQLMETNVEVGPMPVCIPRELAEEARQACQSSYVSGWGLGDAASEYQADYQEYLGRLRQWQHEQSSYESALRLYEQRQQRLAEWSAAHQRYQQAKAAYDQAVLQYQRDLYTWQRQRQVYESSWAAYNARLADWRRCETDLLESYRQQVAEVEARYPGMDAGAGFSCQSAALQAQYVAACAAHQSQYVRGWSLRGGLGQVASTDPCFRAELPVCVEACTHPGPAPSAPNPGPGPTPPGEAPVSPGPKPVTPVRPTPPGARPEPPPVPPGLVPPVTMTPQTTEEGEPAPSAKPSSMMVGGILLFLILGGGYAIYRTQKR